MSFPRLVAIALASAGAILFFGAEVARADDDDCTFQTRKAVIADLTHDGIEGLAKTAGTGFLLLAARGAPAPVKIGSALLFAVEALGLTDTSAQAAEMPLKGDPNQTVRVCHSDGAFAGALGFHALTIVSADPNAADLFQAKIQQDSGASSAPSGLPQPSPLPDLSTGPSAGPAQGTEAPPSADTNWDEAAVEKVLMELRAAPKPAVAAPAGTAALADIPAPPSLSSFDFAAPPPAIPVNGAVVDDATNTPVDQGLVEISTASVTAGLWQTVMIDDDGTFSLDLPPGTYVASVSVPGYPPVRSSFTVADGEPEHDLDLRLTHRSPYPCAFTVVNNTGWKIELFMGRTQGPIEMVQPWSYAQFTLNQAFHIGPQAEFTDGPPLVWPPMPADCDGPGVAYLNP